MKVYHLDTGDLRFGPMTIMVDEVQKKVTFTMGPNMNMDIFKDKFAAAIDD